MNEQITSAAELDALPPLQLMVLEVLAARYRLGEVLWTFTAHPITVRAIRALEAAGLVASMGGVVPRTIRASLTPSGVAAATSPTYRVPDQPQRVQPSREDVEGALIGARSCVTREVVVPTAAEAVLALFAQQPTVAEVKAEALREAALDVFALCMHIDGVTCCVDCRDSAGWLNTRADRIEREARS